MEITRSAALALLQKYNAEPFHILHGLTVEGVMRWYACELGYGEQEDFWGLAGLLHDVDFEQFPQEHCKKAPQLLAEIDAPEALVLVFCHHPPVPASALSSPLSSSLSLLLPLPSPPSFFSSLSPSSPPLSPFSFLPSSLSSFSLLKVT